MVTAFLWIEAPTAVTDLDDVGRPTFRVGSSAPPLPFSPTLEALCRPSADSIPVAVRRVLENA